MRPTVLGGQVHWPDSASQILSSPTQPQARRKKRRRLHIFFKVLFLVVINLKHILYSTKKKPSHTAHHLSEKELSTAQYTHIHMGQGPKVS